MQLPHDVQLRLATEFRFVADHMRETKDPLRKVYFFSAMHSEIGRTLNWHWDTYLALMHLVLQTTHQNLTPKVTPPPSNLGPHTVKILDALTAVAEKLATYFESGAKGQKLCSLLSEVAGLCYATTPHGSYIIEKGLINLSPTA